MNKNIYKRDKDSCPAQYKNRYMTPKEQQIFNIIHKNAGNLITTDQMKGLMPELHTEELNKISSGLAKKGYLYRIKKSVYMIHDEPSKQITIYDPFRIASELYRGYIAFSSALRIYNLIEYEPFTIFIATKRISRKVTMGQYQIKYIAMNERCEGMTFYNGYYISSKTKTFFDCFYRPQYASYSIITKALYLNRGCNWKELTGYFERFASDSMCQRTGYVLDLIRKETDMKILKSTIDYFRKRIKTKTRLFPQDTSAGKYNSEWKVMDNIGRENILSWWYNG